MQEGYMTIADAAKKYGYTPRALRFAIKREQLLFQRIGKLYLIREDDLLAYMNGKSATGMGRPRRTPQPTPGEEPS